MQKARIICIITSFVGIIMISMGLIIQKGYSNNIVIRDTSINSFKIKNIATSANLMLKENNKDNLQENPLLKEIKVETTNASILRQEVFEGMTLDELAEKINRTLKNEISGQGYTIANKCIELGVDPYITTAIIMHETGCGQNSCSNIARNCFNFGGQKGSGCGAYKRYNSIEDGLEGMITNLYNNYYAYGLNTVEAIGPRYAESTTWVGKINWYVNKIRNT